MVRAMRTMIVVVAVLLAAPCGLAHAAPGDLDPSFDGDGMRTFGALAGDVAQAVLVQPDGKLVLAGSGDTDFAVARLNPDGSSDTSFDGGMSGADFGGIDFAEAAALQPDGKIVLAGHTDANFDIAVARFNPDGSLDASFDPGGTDGPGKKIFGYGSFDIANAVLVQPDGKIVVAGNANGSQMMTVTRLNPNGSLDTTFDGDGTATIDFGSLADLANDAVLQSDGKFVVAGYTQADEDVAVARLGSNGSLDTTFGAAGKATIDFGVATFGNAVALQSNGRIVVVGHRTGADDFAVARLLG